VSHSAPSGLVQAAGGAAAVQAALPHTHAMWFAARWNHAWPCCPQLSHPPYSGLPQPTRLCLPVSWPAVKGPNYSLKSSLNRHLRDEGARLCLADNDGTQKASWETRSRHSLSLIPGCC